VAALAERLNGQLLTSGQVRQIVHAEHFRDAEQHRHPRHVDAAALYRLDPLAGPADQPAEGLAGQPAAFP